MTLLISSNVWSEGSLIEGGGQDIDRVEESQWYKDFAARLQGDWITWELVFDYIMPTSFYQCYRQVGFKNPFNSIRRYKMLEAAKHYFGFLIPPLGVHHGDPLGSLQFCLDIHS